MRLGRISVAGLLGVVLAIGSAQVASAHVTVNPNTAPQGSFSKLTFRVPNEEDSANTVKLEVQMPPNTPADSVSVQPTPGWTYVVAKQGDSISTITWSGGSIKPGEFGEFSISMGPLPKDQAELVFKALQTYDNGQVESWIQVPAAGAPEPEHPAPVVTLTAADAAAPAADAAAPAAATGGSDDDSNGLAIAGIVVGGVALVVAIAALVLNRKRAAV